MQRGFRFWVTLPFWAKATGTFLVALIASVCFAGLTGTLDEAHILERIKPVAEVAAEAGGKPIAQKAAVATGDVAKKIYEDFCHTCHATGLAGAPVFGNKSDWAPRIAAGMDTLVKHAIEGYKAMPPKGTCTNCSDEDIKKTVEYMVKQAK